MITIKNADGIFSTEVPTGRLLWVDQVNGVDKLAVRGRLTIPFKTLTAAANAAEPGDTIMVLPGEYEEDELFRNGVNWHFLSGASVVAATVNHDLFGVDGVDLVPFSVTGEGEFDAGPGHCVLLVNDSSAAVTFKARTVKGDNASPVAILDGNAAVHVESVFCANYGAIYIEGGETRLTARSARSTSGFGVHVTGGTLLADIFEIESTESSGVAVAAGACLLRCASIRSWESAVLAYGGTLHLEGAKIFSATSEAPAVKLDSDGLTMRHCWIYASGSSSIGTTGGAQNCRVFGTTANVDVDAGTTDLLNGLTVDSDVTD